MTLVYNGTDKVRVTLSIRGGHGAFTDMRDRISNASLNCVSGTIINSLKVALRVIIIDTMPLSLSILQTKWHTRKYKQ